MGDIHESGCSACGIPQSQGTGAAAAQVASHLVTAHVPWGYRRPHSELMALPHCAGRMVEGTRPPHRAAKERDHGLDREQGYHSAAHQLDMKRHW